MFASVLKRLGLTGSALAALALPLFGCESEPLDHALLSTAPDDLACGETRFTCIDRSVITIWWVCDGTPDCLQGEDEVGCPNKCPMPAVDHLGPAEDGDCAATGAAMLACGLVEDASAINCWDDARADRCVFGCYQEATCTDLRQRFCVGGTPSELITCMEECAARPFVCDDGARQPSDYECDGFDDCELGEDELSCPSFTCDDGRQIEIAYVCDFYVDCLGAEDELGCMPLMCQ
jgi:low density lipoprotein-related protein 2